MDTRKEIESILNSLKKKGIDRGQIEKDLNYSNNYIDQILSKGGNRRFLNTLKGYATQKLQKAIPDNSEHSKDHLLNSSDSILLIELRTASGKSLKVRPTGENDIALLNAFLEERDRVINTLKEEKQARIDELKKDKEDLLELLNSGIGDNSKVLRAIFAMVRTLQEHEAVMTSGGNKKREAEMLDTLTRLNERNLNLDAKIDNAVHLHK